MSKNELSMYTSSALSKTNTSIQYTKYYNSFSAVLRLVIEKVLAVPSALFPPPTHFPVARYGSWPTLFTTALCNQHAVLLQPFSWCQHFRSLLVYIDSSSQAFQLARWKWAETRSSWTNTITKSTKTDTGKGPLYNKPITSDRVDAAAWNPSSVNQNKETLI